MGVRPEDCSVIGQSKLKANVTGEIYGLEPTGDITYLTLKVGSGNMEIKADRDYRSELGVVEHVAFDTNRLYLFDTETGLRVR